MPNRIRLNPTRWSVTHKMSVGNTELYMTIGFYENRQPGEIFIKVAKTGSTMAGLVDSVCVGVSMLLQTGWPMARVMEKYRHTRFEPSDANWTSILDAMAAESVRLVKEGDGDPDLDYQKQKPD